MRLAILPPLFLFVGLACSAPISKEDTLVINEDFFHDDLAIYTSQNDIVEIFLPINALNFNIDEDPNWNVTHKIRLFFVEKDLKSGEDKGLFVRKGNEFTKLLINGRDITASYGYNKKVYFAASDGIYVYDAIKNKAKKYGTVTDDLINIAIDNSSNIMYVLSKNKELFQISENGEKQVKIKEVSNAEQIVMDYENNLYYYTTEKDVYVMNQEIKKIEGLPENRNKLTLLRPPLVFDNSVPIVIDDKAFIIYANGTVKASQFQLDVKPTAYSMEGTLIHYYAYKKKIYEYDILALFFAETFEQLNNYLSDQEGQIQSIASRPRSSIRSNNVK